MDIPRITGPNCVIMRRIFISRILISRRAIICRPRSGMLPSFISILSRRLRNVYFALLPHLPKLVAAVAHLRREGGEIGEVDGERGIGNFVFSPPQRTSQLLRSYLQHNMREATVPDTFPRPL